MEFMNVEKHIIKEMSLLMLDSIEKKSLDVKYSSGRITDGSFIRRVNLIDGNFDMVTVKYLGTKIAPCNELEITCDGFTLHVDVKKGSDTEDDIKGFFNRICSRKGV